MQIALRLLLAFHRIKSIKIQKLKGEELCEFFSKQILKESQKEA